MKGIVLVVLVGLLGSCRSTHPVSEVTHQDVPVRPTKKKGGYHHRECVKRIQRSQGKFD
jgi:hypothetical protein